MCNIRKKPYGLKKRGMEERKTFFRALWTGVFSVKLQVFVVEVQFMGEGGYQGGFLTKTMAFIGKIKPCYSRSVGFQGGYNHVGLFRGNNPVLAALCNKCRC